MKEPKPKLITIHSPGQ